MLTYIVKEVQDQNSDCDGGEVVHCASLRGAKMAATRRSLFQQTVLIIEDPLGQIKARRIDGVWVDV